MSADASIGLAVSHDDGRTFQRYGTGPLLAVGFCFNEPFLAADALRALLVTLITCGTSLRDKVAEIQRNRRT